MLKIGQRVITAFGGKGTIVQGRNLFPHGRREYYLLSFKDNKHRINLTQAYYSREFFTPMVELIDLICC